MVLHVIVFTTTNTHDFLFITLITNNGFKPVSFDVVDEL